MTLKPRGAGIWIGSEHDEVARGERGIVEFGDDRLHHRGIHRVLIGIEGQHACAGGGVGTGEAAADEPESHDSDGQALFINVRGSVDMLHAHMHITPWRRAR